MAAINIRSIGPGVELWTRGDRSLTVFNEPVTDAARQAALADKSAAIADWAIDHNDRLYTLKYSKPDQLINIYTFRAAGRLPVGGKGSTASQRHEASRRRRRTEIMETGTGSRFFGGSGYEPRPGTAAERRLKRQVVRERAAEKAGGRTITTGGELVEPRRRLTHRQVFWPGYDG